MKKGDIVIDGTGDMVVLVCDPTSYSSNRFKGVIIKCHRSFLKTGEYRETWLKEKFTVTKLTIKL